VRNDDPQVDGWLRTAFGLVFSTVAFGLAVAIGIPSAAGLWAMSGATKEEVRPGLPQSVRAVLVVIALATVVLAVVVCLATGSSSVIVNLGLIGLIALAALGLAGAAWFSPHRWRAAVSGGALILVALGAVWILSNVMVNGPG